MIKLNGLFKYSYFFMEEFYTNDFGIVFKICKINLNNRLDMFQTFNIFSQCNAQYKSKSFAKKHHCETKSSLLNQQKPINYDHALKYLMIWVSKKNISFHSLYDNDFDGFLCSINLDFKILKLNLEIKLKNFQILL